MISIVLDLVVLGVLVLFAVLGWHKGLILSLCGLIAFFVAFAGASFVSNEFGDSVSGVIQPYIQSRGRTGPGGFPSDGRHAGYVGHAGDLYTHRTRKRAGAEQSHGPVHAGAGAGGAGPVPAVLRPASGAGGCGPKQRHPNRHHGFRRHRRLSGRADCQDPACSW